MTEKQSKNKKLLRKLLLLILLVYVIPFALVTIVYLIEIRPHVDAEINTFTESIKNVTDPQIRIKEIANFTAKGYFQTYNVNSSPFWSLASIWGFHVFDDPHNLRIQANLLFANDPYFIAYFKTGACGESAVLFNFVANKAGFESRIVRTWAEDHAWNEVKIDNRWVQADPTIYYHYYTHPTTYPDYAEYWFNNTQAYSKIGWVEGGYSTVFVIDTDEDLSTKYCNTSELSVVCQNCDYIKIKPDGRQRFSIDQEMKNSRASFNLGKKNYSIFAGKTLIPFLLTSEKNTTVSLTADEKMDISPVPEEIRRTIWLDLLIVVGFFVLVVFAIWFIIEMIVEIYKKWRSRKDGGDVTDSKETVEQDSENQEEILIDKKNE